MTADLYATIVRGCQQHGMTTEHTYDLIEQLIDSLDTTGDDTAIEPPAAPARITVPLPLRPVHLTRSDVTVTRGTGGWVTTKAGDELIGTVRREKHPSWPNAAPKWVAISHDGRRRTYADKREAAVTEVIAIYNEIQKVRAYDHLVNSGRVTA